MDEEKSTIPRDFETIHKLEGIIEDHVDINGLAEVILKEAKEVTIMGIDVKPHRVVINELMNQISFDIEFKIAQIQAREAKIEAEERRLEKAEEKEEK